MMKKNNYLLILLFIFYFVQTHAQPYYALPQWSSLGNYSVGNVNVGFTYSGAVGLGGCWGVNWTEVNNGYFTFTFDVPVAGVRIYGVDWDPTPYYTNNIAVSINGNPYNLQASNLSPNSHGNSCNQGGRTIQGSISGGNFINGCGTLTITQPGITSLKIQNSGNGSWGFRVEILPLLTTANTPCKGNTLNLSSDFAGMTSGVTYNWTGPNGFTSSLKNPSISNSTTANSGLYTVTASNGTITASQTKNVFVNPIPDVNNVNNQTLCNGSSVNAVNFSSTANAGILCGEVNEGGILNLTAPPASVFTNVQFASYGNATGSCGNFVLGSCNSANSTGIVSAAALGKNSFSLTANNDTFGDPCNGTAKNLKVQLNYNTPISYSWTNSNTSIGLSASGTGNIPSFTATNTTNSPITATITVTPKYTNGGTCSGTSKTFTITVNPSPKITTQPVSETICNGESTTFTAAASNVSNYQWQVDMGSGFSDVTNVAPYSGANTNTLSINEASTLINGYKYRLSASGSCGPVAISNIATLTVPNIVDSPAGDAIQSFNAGDDLSILLVTGQNIKWYATAQDAANYTNQLPSNTLIVNNSTYYATQTTGGCESSASLAIKAYNSLLSVDDNIKSDVALTLYPNPVKDVLHFDTEIKITKIAVFDINGRKLLEKKSNSNHEINVQSLAKGVYLVQVFAEKEKNTLKFIKN